MELPLLIGNAVFAICAIMFWMKSAALKKSSAAEIAELKQKLDEDLKEMDISANQMRETMVADNRKIDTLQNEVSKVYKEKEEELKLRLEAEKQIALAIHKSEDIQKRMYDWKVAQEAAMKDSQDTIIKVGEDLYQKINASHQAEIANSKQIYAQVMEYIKKTFAASAPTQTYSTPSTPAAPQQKEEVSAQAEDSPKAAASKQDLSKKLVADLIHSMKDSNHTEGEKYFIASNFDADKAKMFLCEVAFLQDSHFYIFDFKACGFLSDYSQAVDKNAAAKIVTQKLDKYIAYLSNPKYRNAILKAADSKNIKFETGDIIVVTPSITELDTLEAIGYLEKLEDAGAKVATFDELIDLTL